MAMANRVGRNGESTRIRVYNPIDNILSIGGISGLDVLIVAAIGGRYFFHGPEDVPPILAYSLSTIIGFYFGAGVSRISAANTPAIQDDTSRPN